MTPVNVRVATVLRRTPVNYTKLQNFVAKLFNIPVIRVETVVVRLGLQDSSSICIGDTIVDNFHTKWIVLEDMADGKHLVIQSMEYFPAKITPIIFEQIRMIGLVAHTTKV